MQTILITGAYSGIGKDAAIALAKLGFVVHATTRTQVQADELAKEVEGKYLALLVYKLDILDEADIKTAAAHHIDILINNAATAESGPLAEVPLSYVRNNFETNIFGTLNLTQHILKQMIKRRNGRILIVSSVAGRITLPYLGPYCMTKHALESMGDALRQELRTENISVSLIEPGAIATGFNEKMNESKYDWFKNEADNELIKKYENLLVRDQASTTSVVDAIVHAVNSNRPKTRYVRPRTITVWLARLVPDRLRDWMIRSQLK